MTYTAIKIRIHIAVIFILVSGGCSDQLDISPRTSIAPENLGEDEVEQLLNGVYIQFQNGPGRNNVFLFDLLGGNLDPVSATASTNPFIANDLDPSNGEVLNIWYGYYRGLHRANVLIETIEKLDQTKRNREILGIAHYFRGYAYYGLVTRFGGVPILRENTRDHVPRDPESEVWVFIREELELAIEQAPSFESGPDYFYVTAEAAKALLARTELALGNKERASRLAEEVIESGHFSLEEDYESIYRGSTNSETIFAFANIPGEENTFSALFTAQTFPTGGSYFFQPTEEVLEDLFTAEDVRKEVAFTFLDGTFPMVNKYLTGFMGGDPIIVSRIAEMYLISAEAQGLKGIDRLNQLREIRGLSPLDPDNEQQYVQAVADERRKELIYEGFRWYDLIRTGRAMEELPNITSENQLRLPIPVTELDLNPLLEQNTGY